MKLIAMWNGLSVARYKHIDQGAGAQAEVAVERKSEIKKNLVTENMEDSIDGPLYSSSHQVWFVLELRI